MTELHNTAVRRQQRQMITVNCLEAHLLNLKINVGIDTIRINQPEGEVLSAIAGIVGHSAARYFEFDEAKRDQFPDYRGPLPDVLNCQSGT